MCTVSYIPVGDIFYITSNRDVKYNRMPAIPPASYTMPNGKLVFPRDADAGGSWIAMHENGNVAVLLNGAFEKHVSNPPYKKSRGVVFIEMLSDTRPANHLRRMDLNGIEPFTTILVDTDNLFECHWDGKLCHCRPLEKHMPYIWSSVTLYEKHVVDKRVRWFSEFLNENPDPARSDILHFHRFTGDEDVTNNLMMNRDGAYSTVSMTNITLHRNKGIMKYIDLKNDIEYETHVEFISANELTAI